MPGDNMSTTGGTYGSVQDTQGKTVNKAFGPLNPLMTSSVGSLQQLFRSGLLAPHSKTNDLQREGINGLASVARQGNDALNPAINAMRNFSTGGGQVSSGMQRHIGQSAINAGNRGAANLNRVGNEAMRNSYAENNLANIAAGKNIGAFDANYERLRQRAQENAATEAGMAASGLGRTGSDYHQTAVARQVGDTVAGMDYNRMQDERSRQVEANQMMDAAKQGRLGLGANAYGTASNLQMAGQGLGLNAFNSGSQIDAANRDRQMAASGMLPGLIGARGSLYDMMSDAGDRLQDYQTADLSKPANNLSALLNAFSAYGPYGTQTTSGTNSTIGEMDGFSKEPRNLFGKLLGGVGGIASLFGGGAAAPAAPAANTWSKPSVMGGHKGFNTKPSVMAPRAY